MSAWLYLFLAGLFEIGWPVGFKMASSDDGRLSFLWIAFSAVSMVASGVLLYLSQRTIPIGTAYIVWTGIGGVSTVLIGILFFGDSASLLRLFFLFVVIAGLIGLKIVT